MVIFSGALWLHWPSVNGGFLTRMDDDEYLRQSVRWQGLTWGAIRWAFTSTEPYYQPLPRLSHVLDYQLWGTNARGHHATSVVVHALNTALVFGFIWTLLGRIATLKAEERLAVAVGVAVVFAIHPLQVESVAWMSGRTQLLCTTFGVGCLWAYVAGARRWMVWALFVAALLCKPLAVSLPFAMLAVDYFLLRQDGELTWRRLLRRNAAFIVVDIVAAVATIATESRAGGLLVPLEALRPSQRALLTLQSLMFYPWKLVWPNQLSPYYPRASQITLFQPVILTSLIGVVVITAFCLWRGRRTPALAAGWGTYALFILPVSGLAATGGQGVADRYAYLAIVPLLVLTGGAGVWIWRRCPMIGRCGLAGLLIGELFFFGIRTRAQIPVWYDDETLWRGVLAQFPNSDQANEMLVQALLNQNRIPEALAYARHAAEVSPSAETYRNVGIILAKVGQTQEAIQEFELALQLKPNMADTHCNLAVALQRTGKLEEAIGHYRQALQADPNYADAHYDLGTALVRVNRTSEAVQEWETTLRINPDHAMAQANIGVALEEAGKLEDAVAHYEQALRISPDLATVHFDLGNALVRLGRVTEAIQHYEQALRINPDYIAARNALAHLEAAQ